MRHGGKDGVGAWWVLEKAGWFRAWSGTGRGTKPFRWRVVLVPQLMEKDGHELIEAEKLRRGLYGEHGEPDSASGQEGGMG